MALTEPKKKLLVTVAPGVTDGYHNLSSAWVKIVWKGMEFYLHPGEKLLTFENPPTPFVDGPDYSKFCAVLRKDGSAVTYKEGHKEFIFKPGQHKWDAGAEGVIVLASCEEDSHEKEETKAVPNPNYVVNTHMGAMLISDIGGDLVVGWKNSTYVLQAGDYLLSSNIENSLSDYCCILKADGSLDYYKYGKLDHHTNAGEHGWKPDQANTVAHNKLKTIPNTADVTTMVYFTVPFSYRFDTKYIKKAVLGVNNSIIITLNEGATLTMQQGDSLLISKHGHPLTVILHADNSIHLYNKMTGGTSGTAIPPKTDGTPFSGWTTTECFVAAHVEPKGSAKFEHSKKTTVSIPIEKPKHGSVIYAYYGKKGKYQQNVLPNESWLKKKNSPLRALLSPSGSAAAVFSGITGKHVSVTKDKPGAHGWVWDSTKHVVEISPYSNPTTQLLEKAGKDASNAFKEMQKKLLDALDNIPTPPKPVQKSSKVMLEEAFHKYTPLKGFSFRWRLKDLTKKNGGPDYTIEGHTEDGEPIYKNKPKNVKMNPDGTVDMNDDGTVKYLNPDMPEDLADPHDATLTSSDLDDSGNFHAPVLDLDIPAKLVPSTTPGHHHLFLGKTMSKEAYWKLLDVMADPEVGLIEPGFVGASKARGYSSVRAPWVKKTKTTDMFLYQAPTNQKILVVVPGKVWDCGGVYIVEDSEEGNRAWYWLSYHAMPSAYVVGGKGTWKLCLSGESHYPVLEPNCEQPPAEELFIMKEKIDAKLKGMSYWDMKLGKKISAGWK